MVAVPVSFLGRGNIPKWHNLKRPISSVLSTSPLLQSVHAHAAIQTIDHDIGAVENIYDLSLVFL